MAQARQSSEKMERTDSGFGDCPDASEKVAQPTRHPSIAPSESKSTPQDQSKAHDKAAPTTTRHRPNTHRTGRPSTSQRALSRQSTNSVHVPRSHPSSRSSSFILRQPSATAPFASLRSRSHSTRTETLDPYAFHSQCKFLFSPPEIRPASPSSTANTSHDSNPQSPIPHTTTYWTLPSTRRREYAEIEASTRGIKGFWRRIAPKWWQGGRKVVFSEKEDHSDAGSVRRYRIDLDDEEQEQEQEEEKGGEDEAAGKELGGERNATLERRVYGWNCFGKKE